MAEPGMVRWFSTLFRAIARSFPSGFRAVVEEDMVRHARDEVAAARARGLLPCMRVGIGINALALRDLVLEWLLVTGRALAPGVTEGRPPGRTGGRSARRTGLRETLTQDVRSAGRSVRRSPVFTATAALTLGLGIGASTAIFSVFHGVLLRPLPYPDPDRLYVLSAQFGDLDIDSQSPPNLVDLQRALGDRAVLGGAVSLDADHRAGAVPVRLRAMAVTSSFLPMLGVSPATGRGLSSSDDATGAAPVAVVGYAAWQRYWNGGPEILGSTLDAAGTTVTVVGVLPAGVTAPEAIGADDVDVWLSFGILGDRLATRGSYFVTPLLRLAGSTTRETALELMNAQASAISEAYPDDASLDGNPMQVSAVPLHEATVGPVASNLGMLMAAVGLLLLIACANVGSLYLARGVDRAGELAVRSALGASRRRVAGQLLTESTLTGLLGGGVGVALAWAGVWAFRVLAPPYVPRLSEIVVDHRVLVFALALSIATGLIVGLTPAIRFSSAVASRSGSRAGAHGGRSVSRTQSVLAVVETAVAVVLLVGAGLLGNTLVRLTRVDPGFDPTDVIAVEMDLSDLTEAGARYASSEARLALYDQLLARLGADPDISAVGVSNRVPMLARGGTWQRPIVDGVQYEGDRARDMIPVTAVGGAYLDALSTPLVRGRAFQPSDRDPEGSAVWVNEAFARAYWPDLDPLRGRVKLGSSEGDDPWLNVVGVVGDQRQRSLGREPEPEIFVPFERRPDARTHVVVKARRAATEIEGAVRRALSEIDATLPIIRVRSLTAAARSTVAEPRFYALLLATFSLTALLLCAVGLYGTMSYAAARRRSEMGLRIALGARPERVVALVLGRGLRIAAAGIAVGVLLALGTSRLLVGLVYGVAPTDPATLATVAALLATVCLIACYVPARRAAGADPLETLRAE